REAQSRKGIWPYINPMQGRTKPWNSAPGWARVPEQSREVEPMQTSSAPQRHLPIRKDWLAATQEPALEPDRPIIDPHHHPWDRPGNRYLLHDLIEDLNS